MKFQDLDGMKSAFKNIKELNANRRRFIMQEVAICIKENNYERAHESIESKEAQNTYSEDFLKNQIEKLNNRF